MDGPRSGTGSFAGCADGAALRGHASGGRPCLGRRAAAAARSVRHVPCRKDRRDVVTGVAAAIAAARGERVIVVGEGDPWVTAELLLALVAWPEAAVVMPADAARIESAAGDLPLRRPARPRSCRARERRSAALGSRASSPGSRSRGSRSRASASRALRPLSLPNPSPSPSPSLDRCRRSACRIRRGGMIRCSICRSSNDSPSSGGPSRSGSWANSSASTTTGCPASRSRSSTRSEFPRRRSSSR